MEATPLLKAYAQAASLRLRSNTYDRAEIIEGLKADIYRCILTFIQSWKSALKNENDEKTQRAVKTFKKILESQTGPRAADLSLFDRFATKLCFTLSLAAG